MPVTSGKYKNNETQIYNYLKTTAGLNTAAICGILANIEAESSFNHRAVGDSGTSYGLCQWRADRRTNLINYCKRNGLDSASVTGQLSYMLYELKNSYSNVWNTITTVSNTTAGASASARIWCVEYEIPADRYNVAIVRSNTAVSRYWPYYGANPSEIVVVPNLGQTIVRIARQQLNKSYLYGAKGPNSFDSAGLVYYSYNQAGYNLPEQTITSYYNEFKNKRGKSVQLSNISPGDILFYKLHSYAINSTDHIAIATGSSTIIHAIENRGVVEDSISSLNPIYISRILADSQTSQKESVNTSTGNSGITNYASVASNDIYLNHIEQNLSRVDAVGYDYGYIINMNTGESFKFYTPEFDESAGAEWNVVNIIGRSVSIVAYNHTASRKINITLELYAGVGLYDTKNDPVGKLHSDANFLKSLEYPDYTNPIVRPPATVHIILGSSVDMIGVVSGVTINHKKPLDSQNRSMYLTVSLTVTQTAVNPPDYKDIRNNKYVLTGTDNIDSITINNDQSTNTPVYINN